MKYLEKFQTLLPIGYLYLILLGLIDETLQYYPLGINILNYSSITDILLRPIAEIFSSPVFIIVVISIVLILFIVQTIVVNYCYKKRGEKVFGEKRFNEDVTKKEVQKAIFPIFILFVAFELLSIFVGLGIKGGDIISKKISQSDFTCNYRVNFSSGKTQDIYLFDQNSSYYFYAVKGNKNIMIAPVGSTTSLELIHNKRLNK